MALIQSKPISIKIWIPETWRLPAAYQEVEYIEFYWSQVISTDINSLIAPFKVEVAYKKENTDTSDQTLVWQRQIWKFVNIYQNKYENLWSTSWDWTARADSFMHTIITDSTSWLYKDWILLVSWTSWDKSSSYPLLIWAFSEDSYSSAKWFFKWKIYNVQITNNNILYRNYIPCYRKSDNAIWLYDLVSWNFITNVWSWTLGKWWNIQYNDKNVKAVYVGTQQVRPSATPIATAWIYHNANLWLISISSDWNTWLTIADKNLWATTVWNSWDTLTWANCGNYFQWGNIYAFPNMGTVSFWHSSTKVSSEWYWPLNYYNSSTWIDVNPWDTYYNYDLYWWETDTVEAKRWPCTIWYHIPSITEWTNIFNLWVTLWAWSASNYNSLLNYLKLPLVWIRNWSDTTIAFVNQAAWYWTATRSDISNAKIFLVLWTVNLNSHYNIYYGMPIRPFKNEAVQPDTNRTKLY